jgi:SAM-dependent methyltransferase
MKNFLVGILRSPPFARLKTVAMFVRGLFFMGRRYKCPCCNWSLRGFVDRLDLIATNSDGYCPRCNAKARHRRVWLYLKEHSNLLSEPMRVLDVAPWRSLSLCYQKLNNVHFVGLDLEPCGPHVTLVGNATSMPIAPASFDAVICIHVLEHIQDDRRAIIELFRALRPGGWAVISVPIRLDRATFEDPSITDPEERKIAFGERDHVRYYGADFTDRLESAGFTVRLDLGSDVPIDARVRYGLRESEHIFHCNKPT